VAGHSNHGAGEHDGRNAGRPDFNGMAGCHCHGRAKTKLERTGETGG
jgi:hypothetical protein